MTTARHVGAMPIDSVDCPTWCTISQAEHLADLPNLEGFVIHWSAKASGQDWSVRHADMTFATGQPDPSEPPTLHVEVGDTLTAYAALRFADAVRSAALEALGEVVR